MFVTVLGHHANAARNALLTLAIGAPLPAGFIATAVVATGETRVQAMMHGNAAIEPGQMNAPPQNAAP